MTYTIEELKELWLMLFGEHEMPEDAQWALWLLMHDPGTVREGIVQLANKRLKLNGKMDALYMLKFACSVMNRLTREASNTATVTPKYTTAQSIAGQ